MPLKRRQIYWAHLRRDFKAHAEGVAEEKAFGEAELAIDDRAAQRAFGVVVGGSIPRWSANGHSAGQSLSRLRAKARYRHTRGILADIAAQDRLELAPEHADAAAQLLALAGVLVDLRGPEQLFADLEAGLGSQSDEGERRIERLLSIHTTCRLQRRPLHDYLIDALSAHTRGDPAPLLA